MTKQFKPLTRNRIYSLWEYAMTVFKEEPLDHSGHNFNRLLELFANAVEDAVVMEHMAPGSGEGKWYAVLGHDFSQKYVESPFDSHKEALAWWDNHAYDTDEVVDIVSEYEYLWACERKKGWEDTKPL